MASRCGSLFHARSFNAWYTYTQRPSDSTQPHLGDLLHHASTITHREASNSLILCSMSGTALSCRSISSFSLPVC